MGPSDTPEVGALLQERAREKSNLLLQAQALRASGQIDEAALLFAQAAVIEEELADASLKQGNRVPAFRHQFSAVGCLAQAGNWHAAILLGEHLLSQPDLPAALRMQIQEYTGILRQRRATWSADLVLAAAP
jgi:hypothetical protein